MTKPDALTPLGALGRYANFERIHNDPPAIVTMDHRAVLVAAWAARKQGFFGDEPPLLVRFDAHPDMGEKPRPWAWECSQLKDIDNTLAIANSQRSDDGGWVISAMQFGLCGDVISCFVHDYHRFPGDDGTYEDHRGNHHRLRTFSSLKEAMLSGHADRIRAALASRPVWFDIDLDFATRREEDDSVRVWNENDWLMEFSGESSALLSDIIRHAALVTIATEPWFCGGLSACGRIAADLKRITTPITDLFQKL